MISVPVSLDLPLKTDADGVIRVSGTRVTLHTIITTYNLGESPDAIHEGFATVPLADIYAIIAYYLNNRDSVDDYMREIDEKADQSRKAGEASYTPEQKARVEHFRKLADKKRNTDRS